LLIILMSVSCTGTSVTPTSVTPSSLIAFSSNRDGKDEIYVMNADGSNQTRLTNNPAFDFAPAWSPVWR
jgi:TolB protein